MPRKLSIAGKCIPIFLIIVVLAPTAYGIFSNHSEKTSGRGNLERNYYIQNDAKDIAKVSVDIRNATYFDFNYSPNSDAAKCKASINLTVVHAESINCSGEAMDGNNNITKIATKIENGSLIYKNALLASIQGVRNSQEIANASGNSISISSTSIGNANKSLANNIKADRSDHLNASQEADLITLSAIAHVNSTSGPLNITTPEASISTKTLSTGTITNYEDSVVKSSLGTSIEQNMLISGSFTSTSTAGAGTGKVSKTRNSDYGTKYGLDMQANIASGSPSVKGTTTYYINPNQKVQGAVDVSLPGDTINLAQGTYKDSVVNMKGKAVTVRGDSVNLNLNSFTNIGASSQIYMNSKKILVRADDIFQATPGVQWLTDLANNKNFKVTYAVIPGWVQMYSTPSDLAYLRSLDKNRFELATHGLMHVSFGQYDYATQYDMINQASQIMTTLSYRPRTFVNPFGSGNENTVLAAKALGYHSISADYAVPVDGVAQDVTEFSWEDNWRVDPVTHHSYGWFVSRFDQFYNSGASTYTIVLHPNTYDPTSQDAKTFANSIDYLKGKNLEFMTMEQAYQWDKNKNFGA